MKDFVKLKGFEDTHYINKNTLEIHSVYKKRILKGSIIGRIFNLSS